MSHKCVECDRKFNSRCSLGGHKAYHTRQRNKLVVAIAAAAVPILVLDPDPIPTPAPTVVAAVPGPAPAASNYRASGDNSTAIALYEGPPPPLATHAQPQASSSLPQVLGGDSSGNSWRPVAEDGAGPSNYWFNLNELPPPKTEERLA